MKNYRFYVEFPTHVILCGNLSLQSLHHYNNFFGKVCVCYKGADADNLVDAFDQLLIFTVHLIYIFPNHLHCKNHILIQVLLSTRWNVQTKYLLALEQNFCVTVSSCQLFERCK